MNKGEKSTRIIQNNQMKTNKVTRTSNFSIITLNKIVLKSPIKTWTVADWIKKESPSCFLPSGNSPHWEKHIYSKWKDGEYCLNQKWSGKQAEIAKNMPKKTDFMPKSVQRYEKKVTTY